MLRSLAAAFLVVSVAFEAMAARSTRVWTGAANDFKWSSPGNWADETAPADWPAGDEVRLEVSGDATLTNDVEGLSLYRLVVTNAPSETGICTLRLAGKSLSLTATGSGYAADSSSAYALYCTTTFDLPLVFAATNNQRARAKDFAVTFNGPVTSTASWLRFAGGNKAINVNGDFTATGKTVSVFGSQTLNVYGSLACGTLSVGGDGSGKVTFHSSSNDIARASMTYYGHSSVSTVDSFTTNTVLAYDTNYEKSADTRSNARRCWTFTKDQVANRIDGPAAAALCSTDPSKSMDSLWKANLSGANDSTLTLKGTADSMAYTHMYGAFNLVWDPVGDFTQGVGGMTQELSGKLIVRGGTFASVGTNTFTSLSALVIGSNATFKVTSGDYGDAVDPFPNGVNAEIAPGGAIDVPAGVTVTLNRCDLGFLPIAANTYQRKDGTHATAHKASWVRGDGLVKVTVCDTTCWGEPVSGDWNDDTKWTGGVPTSANGYKVLLPPWNADYEVTMASGDDWPQNLTIRGAGAKLTVGGEAVIEYNGTGKTSTIAIEEGGTLSVAGSLVLTNYAGTFTVGSADTSVTSRLAVSGKAIYAPSTASDYRLDLNAGGAIDQTGGLLSFVRTGGNGALRQSGGTVLASGDAVFLLDCPSSTASTRFESGTVIFSGHSSIANKGGVMPSNWGPQTAGETLYVSFREHSVYGVANDNPTLGTANATTILEFDSDGKHRNRCLGYRMRVFASGASGMSELRLKRGKIGNDGRGFDVADDNKADTVTHGRFVISGGWLYNEGSNGNWSDAGKQNGFTVGYGANAPGTAGTVAFGEVYQSGGTNETVGGVTLVGVGYGEGTYVQTGGYYWHDRADQVFGVGAVGGRGYWTVSNGTLLVKGDAYFGGFHSNILFKAEKMTRWPEARHDAEGTLVAAGGTLDFRKNLVLGADGRGTVDLIGTNATFTVKGDLILSNQVANAASGGTLAFRLKDGLVAPIAVTKKMVVNTGAELIVDVGDVAPAKAQRLVTAEAGVSGAFDPAKVSIVGAAAKTTRLLFDEKGLRIKPIRGLVVFLR